MADSAVSELIQLGRQNAEGIQALTKAFGGFVDQMKKTPAFGTPDPGEVVGGFGPSNIRKGENIMSSRGFSFAKMVGVIQGVVDPSEAKQELDVARRMHNSLCVDRTDGYLYGGRLPERRFLAPLSTSFLPDQMVPREFRREMKSMVAAGVDGADPDEMGWMLNRRHKSMGYEGKALSWLNEMTGGALVMPPEQGELIELLRSKEALVNAGARVVPLPPQGRLRYPRQTAASVAYWVGESMPITETSIGTGDVILQAKKLCVLIKTSNELIRFANPAAEALMRDDMTKSLALGLDLAGLEGPGGDNQPRGVLNFQFRQSLSSSNPQSDGDGLDGRDVYRFPAIIEEINAEFEGYIMRPKTLYRWYSLRTDAVSQGDARGLFLFNLVREAGEGIKPKLGGHPVTTSTQVSQVRSNGTVSDLTYIAGGMWSDMLIGMFGAVEFAATTSGDTPFTQDQTWVRGILSADVAARHEAAFVVMDNLDVVRK